MGIDRFKKFGVTTSAMEHVADVFPQGHESDHAAIKAAAAESSYATKTKEPLGQSYMRGTVLPQECHEPGFAFGHTAPPQDATAKHLIYPRRDPDGPETIELYRKSFGHSEPGEQKDRAYDWNSSGINNPAKFRFGLKEPHGVKNGVAKVLNPEIDGEVNQTVKHITSRQVEAMKDTFDQLGKVRNLGCRVNNLPEDHVYGVKGDNSNGSSRDCIQGSYSLEEPLPKEQLLTIFRRTAKEDATKMRQESQRVTANDGLSLAEWDDDEIVNAIYTRACNCTQYAPRGKTCIEEFRQVMNEYIDAREVGPKAVRSWLEASGTVSSSST